MAETIPVMPVIERIVLTMTLVWLVLVAEVTFQLYDISFGELLLLSHKVDMPRTAKHTDWYGLIERPKSQNEN